jgi:hypothetical protein
MKTIILFFSFLLTTAKILNAQSWAPTGASWTYGVGYAFSPITETSNWTCIGDTVVSGRNCKIIQRYGGYVTGDVSDKLITYEDSNIVYWYNINQFTTLYDFNKNAGDSWAIMTDSCALLVTVDSTGIDTINGIALKTIYVSTQFGVFDGKIIERIGHVVQPNPNVNFPCYGFVEDLNYYIGLSCYEDTNLGFYNFGITPLCNHTSVITQEVENDWGFLIFPNPSNFQLNIQAKNLKNYFFNVYSAIGQLLISGNSEANFTTINISDLENGVYFIELVSDNKIQQKMLENFSNEFNNQLGFNF